MSLFTLIRWILIVGSIVAIVIVANRSKKRAVALTIGFAILVGVIAIDIQYPAENNFTSFKTIEQAFSYSNTGEIIHRIDGSKSGLIIYQDDETIGLCFLPKTEKNRWKISSLFSFDTVYNNKGVTIKNTDYSISVFRVKKTDDYYLVLDAWFVDEKPIVSDNESSNFECVERVYGKTRKNHIHFMFMLKALIHTSFISTAKRLTLITE